MLKLVMFMCCVALKDRRRSRFLKVARGEDLKIKSTDSITFPVKTDTQPPVEDFLFPS